MDNFKKVGNKHVGVGGYKCPCCAPADKKKFRRQVRRALRQEMKRLID